MANTLLIPEVVFFLSDFFTPGEATEPARVCKLWHCVFSGIVWRTCRVDDSTCARGLDLEGLTRNAHHIRTLVYSDIVSLSRYLAPCMQLTTLKLYNAVTLNSDDWSLATDLVHKNINLDTVVIGPGVEVPAEFWTQLTSCRSLRSLDVDGGNLTQQQLREFLKGCRTGPAIPLEALVKVFNEGHLPCLESIKVWGRFSDDALAPCLKAVPPLKELTINHFGDLSFEALSRHFASLERVTMLSGSFTGTMIETTLESCPRLIYISAKKILATRIIRGKPWICCTLKTFAVSILVDTDNEAEIGTQSRGVFEQITRLTCLTNLRVGLRSEKKTQGLDFRLESGLESLSTLQCLRSLDFSGTAQNMSAADVEWVRTNLTHLTGVSGVCNERGTFYQQPGQTE
ncbi:hypothetical protein BGZ52_003760 [Haplosporangium bisporale]|nr:hypothetical protein BGZ52_003760 [Haplosporangium bisporale]